MGVRARDGSDGLRVRGAVAVAPPLTGLAAPGVIAAPPAGEVTRERDASG